MAHNFYECNRNQAFLLPPSLKEWLPEGDLAWFILDAVQQMDLTAYYEKYREDGVGQTAYDPGMMVSLLVYAYSTGVRSSRKIEKLCERDIGFRVMTANNAPDHSTVSRFRQENGEELERIFMEVLQLCAKAGLVKVGVVALDGSKIKANAALDANRTKEHIREEVKKILREAEEVDAAEDKLYGEGVRGDELPEELRGRESRLKRLKECKERLDREAAEEVAKRKEKLEARAEEEKESGRKKRGRKPKDPTEASKKEAKANVTDPESRIMKTRSGYVQGYNGQVVVTEGQVILAAEVTMEENDVKQLSPMVKKAQENVVAVTGEEEKMKVLLADAGYSSEDNFKSADSEGPEYLVATKKDWKQRKAMREMPAPRGRIPGRLSLRERMDRKLLTKRGRALYKRRGQMVEPVFGQIKSVRVIDRFMRRGLEACAQEWKLICATHNLLKLWRSGRGIPALAAV